MRYGETQSLAAFDVGFRFLQRSPLCPGAATASASHLVLILQRRPLLLRETSDARSLCDRPAAALIASSGRVTSSMGRSWGKASSDRPSKSASVCPELFIHPLVSVI